jgi:hypothetical protein
VDLDTSAGVLYLVNEDEGQLYRDREFLERIESRYFDMLFSGKKADPADRPASMDTIPELMEKQQPVGSVLLLSNEIKELSGVTTVSVDTVREAHEGFQYAIMDIAYDESEDYELISDLFFVLADKVRRGGSVIVPERTYWHLPCGAESVEIMCEAAGLMIEAPNADTGRVIIAYKD